VTEMIILPLSSSSSLLCTDLKSSGPYVQNFLLHETSSGMFLILQHHLICSNVTRRIRLDVQPVMLQVKVKLPLCFNLAPLHEGVLGIGER